MLQKLTVVHYMALHMGVYHSESRCGQCLQTRRGRKLEEGLNGEAQRGSLFYYFGSNQRGYVSSTSVIMIQK